ncbi:hypothetical protein KQI63_11020 [bacterium]|nr:hypothetical protein [bacterium]
MVRRGLLVVLGLWITCWSSAQIMDGPIDLDPKPRLGGTLDLTTGMAGEDSQFATNELPPNHRDPHILLHEFNLIYFAPIDDEFSIEARLRIDSRGDGNPGDPYLPLIVLNWIPLDYTYFFSVGRFPTPFGLHPAKQLQRDRTFIAQPLPWGYFLPLSETRGYFPGLARTGYRVNDMGTTTLGFEALSTGIRYDWWNKAGSRFAIALTNAAPSSPDGTVDQLSSALVMRYSFLTSEQVEIGFSTAWGSFMEQDLTIDPFLRDTEQYRQLAFGADWTMTEGMLTLSGEMMGSQWIVPRYAGGQFFAASGDLSKPTPVKPTLFGGYVDARFDFPTRYPVFAAGRLETLQFFQMDDPVLGEKVQWRRDIIRWTLAAGMELTPSLHLKASFSDQSKVEEPIPLRDWAARVMLTALF